MNQTRVARSTLLQKSLNPTLQHDRAGPIEDGTHLPIFFLLPKLKTHLQLELEVFPHALKQ